MVLMVSGNIGPLKEKGALLGPLLLVKYIVDVTG
jgi:hypothetical protein